MLVTPIPSQCFFEQWQQLRNYPDNLWVFFILWVFSRLETILTSDLGLLQDPRSSLCHQNARPFPSCVSGQRYLLFITLNLLRVLSSCPNNFPGGCQSAVLLESSVCHHHVTPVTVQEIRGLCTKLTFSFFLPSLELQTGHMEVLQRQQESQSMWSSEWLSQHASWVFST